jgi:hypothetical protein
MWSQNQCPGCGRYPNSYDLWGWLVNGYDVKVKVHRACIDLALRSLAVDMVDVREVRYVPVVESAVL